MRTLFSETDIKEKVYTVDLTNKFVILSPESLGENYRDAKYQLFFAESGFGCSPTASGRAVYGMFCFDGDETRVNREDILGTATDEAIAEWKRLYGEFPSKVGYEIEKRTKGE